jgi:bla regulator protein BlaR1
MSAVVERLGWMLIHSLWEDVVIWLLLKTALIGLQKKSAQARYLAACVALVAMAVLPWLTFGSMDLSARLQTAAASSLPAFVPAETKSALSVAPAETPSAPVTPPADSWGNGKDSVSRENLLNAVLPWLVAGWAVGVALFAVRLCISWRYLRRLAVLPLTQLSVEWQRRLDELCLTAGVRVFVRAGETAAVLAPIVIGWLRPVILLPLGVLAQLPAEQVEAILFHELAHIRRHDFLVNLLLPSGRPIGQPSNAGGKGAHLR